jgi:capsular polysaccharide biosynthesis protein
MSQQALDLRKSILIIRRLKVVVVTVSALGLLAGAAYAAVNPPPVTSTAVVSFPSSVQNTATQVVIAGSYPVLAAASVKITPHVSVDELRTAVQVKSLTPYLISITATGKTAADAEATANAVANSYIAYVGDKKSPVVHVVAEMFQSAVTATGSSRVKAMLITGLIGALVGAIVGSVLALAIGRKDRRLRARDQIANSIGIPVLASVPVGHPSDPEGWTKLLENYKPHAVHAWQLRTVLRYLGVDQTSGQPLHDGYGRGAVDGDGDSVSLGVVSLSSDPGALALGPQLAVFAASQGIPTALVIGPQQDANATAALRTACATPLSASSSERPGLLRLIVSGDHYLDQQKGAALVVVVAVVDGRAPEMPATVRTAATVIGVSAGGATAEQLARAAVAAAADGRDVTGILVADPESTDQTTGRVPHLIRPPRRRLPNRLKGAVTETRR